MTDLHRRAILRGTAVSAITLAATAGVSPDPATAANAAMIGPVLAVADRKTLTGLADLAIGDVVFLREAGREGHFRCVPGPAPARDDRLEGLAVASSIPGRHFARIWDGTHGRPEWFGAVPNDGNADCADAIEACYALCPVSDLGQADYFVRRTLRFATSARTVRGAGRYATDTGRGTRIVLGRAAGNIHDGDILVVGSATNAHAPYPNGIHLSNLTLVRDGRCTPHPSGDITRYPTGLRASFLEHCTFREITSIESSVGFYIGGVVYTKFDDCFSLRAQPGTSARDDFMIGYYLNGHIAFGYAGGNASLYMNRCLVADQHPQHVDPTGLLARGAFVDSFIDGFESARIGTGMAFRVDGARAVTQSVDLHIRSPVLDGCSRFGIDIDLDQTSSASIEIVDPYIYAAGGGGDRGILVHGGAGLVTLNGGQVHGDFAGGSLWFSRTRGIRVQGTKIQQSSHPVVVAEASGLLLEPQINNDGKRSEAFAITCAALSRSIVRPIIIGASPPAFRGGISLDAGCGYCEIDGSAIDPGCFAIVDAAYKVWFAGGDARSGRPGATFTARANRLVGVTA